MFNSSHPSLCLSVSTVFTDELRIDLFLHITGLEAGCEVAVSLNIYLKYSRKAASWNEYNNNICLSGKIRRYDTS
jgi:hypothetical protein